MIRFPHSAQIVRSVQKFHSEHAAALLLEHLNSCHTKEQSKLPVPHAPSGTAAANDGGVAVAPSHPRQSVHAVVNPLQHDVVTPLPVAPSASKLPHELASQRSQELCSPIAVLVDGTIELMDVLLELVDNAIPIVVYSSPGDHMPVYFPKP